MEQFPEDSPFKGYQIWSHDPLRALSSRQVCEKCKSSVKYYCYHCIRLISAVDTTRIPQVPLPLHLAIIKDKREQDGKSTVIHAKILADKDTSFYEFDGSAGENGGLEAAGFEPEGSVVLFPSSDSVPVEEVDWSGIKQLVVIDGTWRQAKGMCVNSPLVRSLPKVHLSKDNKTLFWRYQQFGPHCLSTIEAIYYFYKEYLGATRKEWACLDNLLYFFAFFYHIIQESYIVDPKRPVHSRLGEGYIKKRNKAQPEDDALDGE